MPNTEIQPETSSDTAGAREKPQYQPSVRGREHTRLEAFVGRWNTVGQAHDGPFGAAATIKAVETYEWLPGRLFLIHRLEGRLGDNEMACVEVIGYDASSDKYSVRSFYNDGTHNSWQAREHNGTWTLLGDGQSEGKPLKVRCTAVFDDAGTVITGKWEYSRDGSSWHCFWDTKLTRA